MRLVRRSPIGSIGRSALCSALCLVAAALFTFGAPLFASAEALPGAPSNARTQPQSAAQGLLAQEYPAPPFYQLLPHDYPYPLIRTCYTYAGICAIPFTIQPGTPCSCEASNGVRVSGVCTK